LSPATLPRVRDYADLTRRLADLIVGYGANVQPGQVVAISTYTGKEPLAREVARAAYERGARWVDVLTFDPWIKRQRLVLAPDDSLEFVPPWMVERLEWLSAEHAARITLNGPAAPEALEGVDPGRAGRDLLPYLPNIRRIEIKKREQEGSVVKFVNVWHGGGDIPTVARAFLSESMLAWTDFATWRQDAFECDWRFDFCSLRP